MVPLPRTGHALGDPRVPDAVLAYVGNLHIQFEKNVYFKRNGPPPRM
jgi:hypothetical protein